MWYCRSVSRRSRFNCSVCPCICLTECASSAPASSNACILSEISCRLLCSRSKISCKPAVCVLFSKIRFVSSTFLILFCSNSVWKRSCVTTSVFASFACAIASLWPAISCSRSAISLPVFSRLAVTSWRDCSICCNLSSNSFVFARCSSCSLSSSDTLAR